jgi:RNA polymerase-binding transcription factor DksA
MQKATLAKRLEEEKARLEMRMSSVGQRNPAVPNDWEPVPTERGGESDLADQADIVVSREENAAILADLEARYDAVLEALERMQKGTYGTCGVCGKKIEAARLEADPAARTCKAHMR